MNWFRSFAAAVALCVAISALMTSPASARRYRADPYQAYQQQQYRAYQAQQRQYARYQRQMARHAQYGYQHTQYGYTQPEERVTRRYKRTRTARREREREREKPVKEARSAPEKPVQTPDANGSPVIPVTTVEMMAKTAADAVAVGEVPDTNLKIGAVSTLQSYKDYQVEAAKSDRCRAGTVRVVTAFDIPICVDNRFAQKFAYFFALLKEKGCEVKEIVCQSWGHMRGSNHHGGGACDVDQLARNKTTAKCMYNSGDLVKKAGLYDGCWWGNKDCGHVEGVEGLFNYGRTHYAGRSKHRARYAKRHHHRYASR